MPKHDMKAALKAASRTQQSERFDAAATNITASGSGDQTGHLLLPMGQIRANPNQPRQEFDQAALEELAASIRELGVLQPLAVRRAPDGLYDLIAGERRLRAGKIARLEAIPAVVLALDDQVSLEASLAENLQREDLYPMEEAVVFRRMVDELGYSIRRLAERLGKGKGYVEDRLRLTRMEPDLQRLVSGRPDTLTHAREIEKVQDSELREELIRKVEAEQMPLQELRERIGKTRRHTEVSEETTPAAAEAPGEASPKEAPVSNSALSGRPDTIALFGDLGDGAPQQPPHAHPKSEEDIEQPLLPLLQAVLGLRSQLEQTQLPQTPEQRSSLITELQAAANLIHKLLERLKAPSETPS